MRLGWAGFRRDLFGTEECDYGNANNGDGEDAYKKLVVLSVYRIQFTQIVFFEIIFFIPLILLASMSIWITPIYLWWEKANISLIGIFREEEMLIKM